MEGGLWENLEQKRDIVLVGKYINGEAMLLSGYNSFCRWRGLKSQPCHSLAVPLIRPFTSLSLSFLKGLKTLPSS